jgi:hypothetical protein
LSSSVHKGLDFPVLSLNNLGHCLVEEVLSCISSSSAFGSRPVLAFELPLVHWHLVWLSDDWVDLMINNEIMTIFTNLLLGWWHC